MITKEVRNYSTCNDTSRFMRLKQSSGICLVSEKVKYKLDNNILHTMHKCKFF